MKKLIHPTLIFTILGSLLLTIPSCVDEDDFDMDKLSEKVDWTPNMIVPAGTGTYTLWGLLDQHEENKEDATIVLGADGMLHIMHTEKDIFSYDVNEILNFPAQNPDNILITIPDEIINAPVTPPAGKNLIFPSVTDIFRMEAQTSVNTPILSEIQINTGLNFRITNPISEDITVKVIIPQATLAGVSPALFTINVPGGSINDASSWNLEDFTINFPTPSVDNEIEIRFDAEITASGNPITNTGNQLAIDYNFDAIDFQLAKGDFRQQTIDLGSDEFDLDVDFWEDVDGEFKFYDPRINLTFRNGIGVPFDINLALEGFNTDGNSVAINPDPLAPDYPKTEEKIDELVVSTLTYDKTQGIDKLLNLPPDDRINYSGSININPKGAVDLNTEPNIVKSTSSIAVDMEIDIPLEFSATELAIQDTIDDLDISDAEKITNGKLVIVTQNGIPLDVVLKKISLTDADFNEIASVDETKVFKAAEVFPAGHEKAGQVDPSKIVEQSAEVIFKQETIAKLNDAENIIIKAAISTTNDGNKPVKIMGSDQIVFKLAVQAQLDFNK
ncbi:MAG: hypothetical protein ACEPOZ_04725 [Marinifilaceae bacterium]